MAHNAPAAGTAASHAAAYDDVRGELLTRDGTRFYCIRNYDAMPPFFMSVISSADHWLFVSSTGGLSAGRVAPEKALFPYVTVDKIHAGYLNTGPRTLVRSQDGGETALWEPFNREHDGLYRVSRNLFKSVLGHAVVFEEINHDLELAFSYEWTSCGEFGFARRAKLENLGAGERRVSVLDGLQNIMPAGTPRSSQDLTSNLVDAYCWSELDAATGLAVYTLYSGISDRAEPCESLHANIVFALGANVRPRLLSGEQLSTFRRGEALRNEPLRRGVRGAYFVEAEQSLAPGDAACWQLVADVEQSQSRVSRRIAALGDRAGLAQRIADAVEVGAQRLAAIMGSADAFQLAGEEVVTAHHYANVLFNVLRGGIFNDQYCIGRDAVTHSIEHFNRQVAARHADTLAGLPERLPVNKLLELAAASGDPQLQRLCYEYLPVTFGRRHGDPSRPWNRFTISLRDAQGKPRLSYEGNWRDIFQNWEALTFSYPEFIESVIAKFLNASTVDGYNPYRITDRGIDWEVEDPDDPWSYIGYWGDHQIIYLQKLLELSERFHPQRLVAMLDQPLFAFANVPYRIKPFASMRVDPKNTVVYDSQLAEVIEDRVQHLGADGKLLLDHGGEVHLVTLAEKLLIPLLTKMCNYVAGGGIWLNTQRPEWNDANNALVGNGLSMVTLYYMRRYVGGLRQLLAASESSELSFSQGVSDWLREVVAALTAVEPQAACGDAAVRFRLLEHLCQAADDYREAAYAGVMTAERDRLSVATLESALEQMAAHIDATLARGRREDGLYHAYNLMHFDGERAECEGLYLMLEGQVAALSSGAVAPEAAVELLEALFASDCYRADVDTFMLYPDRSLPAFLEKNRVAPEELPAELASAMRAAGDRRLFEEDAAGWARFSADFRNVGDLHRTLDRLRAEGDYGQELIDSARPLLAALYERVFRHRAFTGRSGGMFGFEGLGCVYWHMVAKLLLAVQENFFAALDGDATADVVTRLGDLYYRVRAGIGFNKTPREYGAFPADPYSHTPAHLGAQQPGMTGQVKEEVLTRFGELGLRVAEGRLTFVPRLLRRREFLAEPGQFRFLAIDGGWQTLPVPPDCIAFSWCQVPIVYQLAAGDPGVTLFLADGSEREVGGLRLSREDTAAIAEREGAVHRVLVRLPSEQLFGA